MKIIDTVSPEAVALTATIILHEEVLHDDQYPAYNGTKEAFDNLYQELFAIALDKPCCSSVVLTWYRYQDEIRHGKRIPNWHRKPVAAA